MRDNVVPLCADDEFEKRCEQWVQERIEWDSFEEISGRYIELMEAALKSDDVWEPIRVTARCERITRVYLGFGDRWLSPFRRQLQDTLYTAHRIARRLFIRRALTGKGKETPFDADLKANGKWDTPDALADRAAVERHLREGSRLLEGLTRRGQVG
jgi:hypothetical protein